MRIFTYLCKLIFRSNISNEIFDTVFFGLGNPGEQYAHTRHNIGFRIIDSFNDCLSDRKRVFFPDAEVTKGKLTSDTAVATIKPLSYMNRSGFVVAAVLKKWKTPQNKCLVVVDDIHIPLGTIRARRNGTHGGHNGLKSIIGQIGTDFPRLRIGIGPRPEQTDILDFVLGNFNVSEEEVLTKVITRGHEILKTFAADGIDAVMNNYN